MRWPPLRSAFAGVMLVFAACQAEELPTGPLTAQVKLTPEELTILRGDTSRLSLSIVNSPQDPEIAFRSLSPAIATVSEVGLVQALRPGQTAIVVTVRGPRGTVSDTSKVVVQE